MLPSAKIAFHGRPLVAQGENGRPITPTALLPGPLPLLRSGRNEESRLRHSRPRSLRPSLRSANACTAPPRIPPACRRSRIELLYILNETSPPVSEAPRRSLLIFTCDYWRNQKLICLSTLCNTAGVNKAICCTRFGARTCASYQDQLSGRHAGHPGVSPAKRICGHVLLHCLHRSRAGVRVIHLDREHLFMKIHILILK